jgi:hypothetical protein
MAGALRGTLPRSGGVEERPVGGAALDGPSHHSSRLPTAVMRSYEVLPLAYGPDLVLVARCTRASEHGRPRTSPTTTCTRATWPEHLGSPRRQSEGEPGGLRLPPGCRDLVSSRQVFSRAPIHDTRPPIRAPVIARQDDAEPEQGPRKRPPDPDEIGTRHHEYVVRQRQPHRHRRQDGAGGDGDHATDEESRHCCFGHGRPLSMGQYVGPT